VVGGGSLGPEIYAKFIELAGGPDALIIDVPTAGGDSTYPAQNGTTRAFRAAGAKNVVVLHTIDRKLADSDSFATLIGRAGGVWFDGGRQWHLVDRYAGTRTEQAFRDVLARGGVVGGSSAGASILSSYMLRGARSGNNIIMAPGYEVGFGYLRNTAIDQHVVARDRLPDLADSLMPRRPDLLGISEDEGTAWVVRGDTGEIIGRSKAFVYGGAANDSGKPFLTLRPGDRYDLGARRVLSRAIDASRLRESFVDSLFRDFTGGDRQATVMIAEGGRVLVNRSYGVPPQPRHTPTTTAPQWPIGGLAAAHDAILDQLAPATPDSARAATMRRSVLTPVGAGRTVVSARGQNTSTPIRSNVDDLYRLALGLDAPTTFGRDSAGAPRIDPVKGWTARTGAGGGVALYGTPDGTGSAFVRLPDRRITIILVTNRDDFEARRAADRIVERLVGR
jgi:cyanophycinase